MSVKIMSEVWSNESLPHMPKMVLLAIADHANDDGVAYPGNDRLARKVATSTRTIVKSIKWLEENGYLVRESTWTNEGRKRNVYVVNSQGEDSSHCEATQSELRALPKVNFVHFAPYIEPSVKNHQLKDLTNTQSQVVKRARAKSIDEPEGFDRFWDVYPRRVAKREAIKAFTQAVADGVDTKVILDGAQRYALAQESTESRFTAHPATWLNGHRWEDEEAVRIDPRASEATGPRRSKQGVDKFAQDNGSWCKSSGEHGQRERSTRNRASAREKPMDAIEVGKFLGKAALVDNRNVTELHVMEWLDHIGYLSYEMAIQALNTHRAESNEYLQPAHILQIVRKSTKDRPTVESRDTVDLPAPRHVIRGEWFRCLREGNHSFKGGYCVFCACSPGDWEEYKGK